MEYWKFIRNKVGNSRVIIPGVDVAIVKDSQILLVQNKENLEWFLPGGLQELEETVFETGEREVLEELGITVKAQNLISVYSGSKWIRKYTNGDELQSLTFLISANLTSNTEIKIDESEIADFNWFDLKEVPDNMHDYSAMMIKDVLEFNGTTIMR